MLPPFRLAKSPRLWSVAGYVGKHPCGVVGYLGIKMVVVKRENIMWEACCIDFVSSSHLICVLQTLRKYEITSMPSLLESRRKANS